MKRFFCKALIWLAKGFAVLIVLLLIFYAEEDWRGARDWAACQKELQAKGEILDLRQLAPPGKPEDDLSKVPIFAEIYQQPPPNFIGLIRQDSPKSTRLDRIDVYLGSNDYDKYPKNVGYLQGHPLDLVAWQKFYRTLPQAHLTDPKATPAQDVLQALSQFDAEMKEVEIALKNPNAYWPLNYDRPFDDRIEGITSMIRIAEVLPLRATAHLDNHETDLAERDYLLSFQTDQSLANKCLLINYIVIFGVCAIDNAILWEGLHRHAWNDAQLREMELALASTDMLALGAQTFRTERARVHQTMKMMQAGDPKLFQDLEEEDQQAAIWRIFQIRPRGWWNEDRLHYSLMVQKAIEGINVAHGTINSLAFDRQKYEGLRTQWRMIYTPISLIIGSNCVYIGPKIAKAETYRRLARLACRLEEYRIGHGTYPEKLEELPDLPAHLNQEVLSEEPLRYQRKGDGYQLYSVGWDQKDDGGVFNKDDRMGDWPWPGP